MHGTMQARLAASAKLSLTVASKTGPPPTAALTAILLAVRSAQQPPLSYALHFFADSLIAVVIFCWASYGAQCPIKICEESDAARPKQNHCMQLSPGVKDLA